MTVVALDGVIRRYDWGSTSAIQELLGEQPDGRPAAELWFGAHQDDPAQVASQGTTLDALVAAAPAAELGAEVTERFDDRLPFLLKVLAADKALSLQVHPTIAQAQAGFAAEDSAGVGRDAGERNYRDTNHKPELICALTEFDALCGFRPVPVIRDVLAALALPELDFLSVALDSDDPLRSAFTAVLDHPQIASISRAVGERASGRGETLHGVALAAADFPEDAGVVLALLLNYVRLQPGEAIYLGAGNVHCYLRGTGVEIMANSDNVLRCGLTSKHVDVPELLKITDFAPVEEPRWPSHGGSFEVPVPDFRLVRLTLEPGARMSLHDAGPTIVLCADGAVSVGDVAVARGHAAFVGAGTAATLAGHGLVFVAGVGRFSPG
jgi:mannose-6-phosphate isomerase